MVNLFRQEYPQAEPFFLMGSDSLRDLLAWEHPDELIRLTQLVVMQRPSVYPDLAMLTRHLPRLLERVFFLDAPEIEISSTDIVARVKQGRSIRYRVCDAVLAYMTEHGLYVDDET
jgi:nicotinate-nucleotide adenylyltransferase